MLVRREPKKTLLRDIDKGTSFQFPDSDTTRIYIKTSAKNQNNNTVDCVDLVTGNIMEVHIEAEIIPLEAEIIIK